MRTIPTSLAFLILGLAACTPAGHAPKVVETMRALGFAEMAYATTTESQDGVVLHDVTGKDLGGRAFRAASLRVTRRAKDDAWSSMTIEGYADEEASARAIRFGEMAWADGAPSPDVMIEGANLRTPRATYSVEQISIAPKQNGASIRARGARLTMPGVTAVPLSHPMRIDLQASAGAGGVLRIDFFSIDSEALAAKGTTTFAAPGLQATGWSGARALLALDWTGRAMLLDLDASLDARLPIPALATPNNEGSNPARQGQGLSFTVRTTGEPIQASGFAEAWRAAIAGLPSRLAIDQVMTRTR